MQYRFKKLLSVGAVLIGLCPLAQANTTTTGTVGPRAVLQLAQTDLAVPPFPVFANTEPAPPPAPSARIALLLPLRSVTLNQAAEAVRAGFMAAHEREQDGIAVDVVETGDIEEDLVPAYAAAAEQHDIVVGPLSRSDVTALAQSGAVNKPTIALTQVEAADDAELPRQMLAIGLSIESEARQAATWAAASRKTGKALVLSTATAWQARAVNAFAAQWQKQGRELESVELTAFGGYLSAKTLSDLKKLVESDEPALLFAALDARQAQQVREALGSSIPLYGTSQLNPFAPGGWNEAEPVAKLNGARLLDIPWQLEPDHPAVMVYPRPVAAADERRSADLERLYALGIDAYRIAREIAFKHTSFELDGVTGKLTVRFGGAAPYFERTEQRAIYRDGSVVAVADRR